MVSAGTSFRSCKLAPSAVLLVPRALCGLACPCDILLDTLAEVGRPEVCLLPDGDRLLGDAFLHMELLPRLAAPAAWVGCVAIDTIDACRALEIGHLRAKAPFKPPRSHSFSDDLLSVPVKGLLEV
mmetsp:Transcript_13092/g.29778  ORF Transcript_13092/g.29778 Transcript_13092/m.29778 type:complete len:126 (-) Transcript_13092:2352-2729(-)